MPNFRFIFLVLLLFCLAGIGDVWGQCGPCTIEFNGNGNPLPNRNVQNNDVVCVSGDRINNLNLQNATNIQVCISNGVILSGNIQNIQTGTRISNFGQYGTVGTPRNLTLSGNNALFLNEGTYFGNFTSNNGADITNRGTITGSVSLNSGSASYINSGTQIGALTANSGTSITNDGVFTLSSISINSGSNFTNSGNSTVSGNFQVDGTLNNQGNLSITGNFTGNGGSSVTNSGNLSVTGNFTNNTTINSSSGSIYIGGDLSVNGGSTFNSGNTSIDGNVSNNGNINLNGQLSINGNLNLNGGSNIRGGSNLQCNSLIVQGPTFSNGGNIGGGTNPIRVNKIPTSGNNFGSNATQGSCACTPREIFSSGLEVILIYNCPGSYTWSPPEGLTQYEVLVVGGGGSGGNTSNQNENKAGGGGGAGAVRFETFTIPPPGLSGGQTFNITVGGGGNSNGTNDDQRNGSSSLFSNGTTIITSNGGGAGGRSNGESGRNGTIGINGSAGGGAGAQSQNTQSTGGMGRTTGGNSNSNGNSTNQYGGGGGGANTAANGENAGNNGGVGGNGSLISIGFINRYGGGGGGGAASSNSFGNPGLGGGGIGGNGSSPAGDGLPNTGAGGGGAGGAGSTSRKGGDGGSGVVIIRYENLRILPVEFLFFKADYNSPIRTGDLSWATAKEWENSHFEIERSVNDVKSWTVIDQVEGAGYSDAPVDYTFQDKNLPAAGGNIFYRLKQVDFNGNSSYSVTRAIRVEGISSKSAWLAYPNPSSIGTEVKIDWIEDNYQDEPILIQVSDLRGVSRNYSVSSPDAVKETVNLHLANAKPGMYLVQLLWGDQSQTLKLVKN